MGNAIQKAAGYISQSPQTDEAHTLHELCLALEGGGPFPLDHLYRMSSSGFELALGLMQAWRFDQYITTRRQQYRMM